MFENVRKNVMQRVIVMIPLCFFVTGKQEVG